MKPTPFLNDVACNFFMEGHVKPSIVTADHFADVKPSIVTADHFAVYWPYKTFHSEGSELSKACSDSLQKRKQLLDLRSYHD